MFESYFTKLSNRIIANKFPNKALTAQKVNGINIDLLSVGKTCDQQYISVFKEKEMFIANEKDVEIIMYANPLVIGTRQGEGHDNLWKIPLSTAEELTNNND